MRTSVLKKTMMRTSEALGFDDITLIPAFSEIESRSDPSTTVSLGGVRLETPIISANMDTVTESSMATVMWVMGGRGAIHRFMTPDQNVTEYKKTRPENGFNCFVTVGVKDWFERACKLYSAGARCFVIDVAHGHSSLMKVAVMGMRRNFPDIVLMAGNVATAEAVRDLASWGANIVKAGVGSGCFIPGTLVRCEFDVKAIENIRVGEKVWTHLGNLQIVTDTLTFYRNEKLMKINDITCTGNHEFYVIHKNDVSNVNEENIHQIAKWIPANELTNEYMLVQLEE